MTDMTDHLAKTRAQLEACARRGQWAQVAKIGGFKSEEAAKDTFSHIRRVSTQSQIPWLRQNVKDPSRDTTGMVSACVSMPAKTFNNSQGVDVQPASREWVLKCKSRIAAMGLNLGDVSRSMGMAKSYLPNRFMATGHCSPQAKALIEAHLDYLETVVKSA